MNLFAWPLPTIKKMNIMGVRGIVFASFDMRHQKEKLSIIADLDEDTLPRKM